MELLYHLRKKLFTIFYLQKYSKHTTLCFRTLLSPLKYTLSWKPALLEPGFIEKVKEKLFYGRDVEKVKERLVSTPRQAAALCPSQN